MDLRSSEMATAVFLHAGGRREIHRTWMKGGHKIIKFLTTGLIRININNVVGGDVFL